MCHGEQGAGGGGGGERGHDVSRLGLGYGIVLNCSLPCAKTLAAIKSD